jgi:hypothetical protein
MGRYIKNALWHFDDVAQDQSAIKNPHIAMGIYFGAAYRIRTDDLPLTRRLLYQLS